MEIEEIVRNGTKFASVCLAGSVEGLIDYVIAPSARALLLGPAVLRYLQPAHHHAYIYLHGAIQPDQLLSSDNEVDVNVSWRLVQS